MSSARQARGMQARGEAWNKRCPPSRGSVAKYAADKVDGFGSGSG
jgi:hypothetical protein